MNSVLLVNCTTINAKRILKEVMVCQRASSELGVAWGVATLGP